MRYWFVILLLAGCGSGGEPAQSVQTPPQPTPSIENHGYGFQYDMQGASGLRLRGAADMSQIETLYAATETCTGLNAPAPFVIIVPPHSLDVPGPAPGTTLGVGGEYLNQPSLILLDPARHGSMEHESIHYLLDVNTGDPHSDHKGTTLFNDCVHS